MSLVDRIAGAELGALGERYHPRLDTVLVVDAHHRLLNQLRGQLAIRCGDGDELAPEKPLGSPAFVDVDVRAR